MDKVIRQTKTGRLVIRSAHRRRSIRAAITTSMLHTIGVTCLMAGALHLYCISQGADDLYLGLLGASVWAGAPFLLVGMGAYHLDDSLPPGASGEIDATDFAPRLGGGVDYYLTQSIALTGEVVYVIGTRRLHDLDYVGISLGLTYRF